MTKQPTPQGDYRWHNELKQSFVRALDRYRAGETKPLDDGDEQEIAFFRSIGLTGRELFDFVDDHVRYGGDPDWETVLLISAVRRDYFLVEQRSEWSTKPISANLLPAKDDRSVGQIPWLARLIGKAEGKLRGELPAEVMFGCAGDRSFFRERGVHPADFLRQVWAARGDTAKIVEFLRLEP